MNKNEDSCPDGETIDFSAPFVFHSPALRASYNQDKLVLKMPLSGMLRHVVLRTHHCFGGAYCLHLQCLPRKHLHLCTNTNGVMSHKSGFVITTVGRTSNLPVFCFAGYLFIVHLILTELTVHTV
jgi:hypothetical protein